MTQTYYIVIKFYEFLKNQVMSLSSAGNTWNRTPLISMTRLFNCEQLTFYAISYSKVELRLSLGT